MPDEVGRLVISSQLCSRTPYNAERNDILRWDKNCSIDITIVEFTPFGL